MLLKSNYRNAAGSAVPEEKVITYFLKVMLQKKGKKRKSQRASQYWSFTNVLGIF